MISKEKQVGLFVLIDLKGFFFQTFSSISRVSVHYIWFTNVSSQTHDSVFNLPALTPLPLNGFCTCLLMCVAAPQSQIYNVLNPRHSAWLPKIQLTFPKASTFALSPACNGEDHLLP